jgi:GMP synthase-like glutamine amidotransferase
MLIGILMAGHFVDPLRAAHGQIDGLFRRLLDGHGFAFRTYHVEAMAFPGDVRDCDGWIVTGSKHGAYEDHPFIPPLEAFIRDAHAADVPLVGICFGHQIVAKALGGRVEKWPGGWALGRTRYETTNGDVLHLNAWHQDQVTLVPEGAEILARGPDCRNAAIAYGDRILTIQPHPEFGADVIESFVATRRGTGSFPDDRMDAAGAATAAPLDSDRLAGAIARFLKTRVAHV